MNKIGWWIFGILCVIIGLYPLVYFSVDREFGLLASKSQELLTNQFWNIGFYGHITLGGVALIIGWTQFNTRLRLKRIKLHRTIGKIYIIAAIISGTCGIFIAQFATGGISNIIGFSFSGLIWVSTTILFFMNKLFPII